ncbi:MAG: hypothetical protein GXP19_05600 [Gammaproteobacteria bacterium]|nr:hypothetical protein [Gammaproteobacteria bacterium]
MVKYPALLSFLPAILINLLIINSSHAAGFALIENSASGMGTAFAGGSAIADDASTVYFNPAGIVRLSGEQAVAASHIIIPQAKFKNQGSTAVLPVPGGSALSGDNDDGGRNAFVVNFYYTRPIDDKLTFGFGVNTPFGLETTYDDDWVGRYHAVESNLLTLNFNPSVAFKFNDKFSAGFGLSGQYVDVTLSSAIDFGSICFAALGPATCTTINVAPQQTDGFAKLTGTDFSFGWNAGVLFQLNNSTRFGVAYRSQIHHTVNGDANFTVPGAATFATNGGAFVDTGLTAKITLPQTVSVSGFHEINKDIAVMADITWTGWNSFQELRIQYDNTAQPDSVTTEDWNNVFRYAIGAQYHLDEKWLLRAGLAYDESPIPSAERRTPRLPGNDRKWLSFGFSYSLMEKLKLDVGYSHLFVSDVKINNTFESSVPTLEATLTGEYEASVDILSAQLEYKF